MVNLLRPNIRALRPYRSARSEYSGTATTWLDANESPYDDGLNRYPDPLQQELKAVIVQQRQRVGYERLSTDQLFLGNGSDEAIDLLMRAFCEPGKDHILTQPPTYGMYRVCADINAIDLVEIPLSEGDFLPDTDTLLRRVTDEKAKLTFFCSPNNSTGNLMPLDAIRAVAKAASGLVVVDEAYIDFAEGESAVTLIELHPNVVVLQTFSKAWGRAGIRLGMAWASEEIIKILNSIKPPYNINTLTIDAALARLVEAAKVGQQCAETIREREWLSRKLHQLAIVKRIYPSRANFLLVAFENATMLYQRLLDAGIVVRDRRNEVADTLRITVGTPEENRRVIKLLQRYCD